MPAEPQKHEGFIWLRFEFQLLNEHNSGGNNDKGLKQNNEQTERPKPRGHDHKCHKAFLDPFLPYPLAAPHITQSLSAAQPRATISQSFLFSSLKGIVHHVQACLTLSDPLSKRIEENKMTGE